MFKLLLNYQHNDNIVKRITQMLKKFGGLLLVLLLGITTLHAEDLWKADRIHSNVGFTVTHMLVSEVGGKFTDFDASLTAAKDDFSDMKIEATIKTASVSTDNEKRDGHLKSDDFFNAEKYPAITFKSTKVEKTGTDTYKITGDLTIRDITKPVALDTKLKGVMTDSRGNTRAGFKATTTIDRFEFGTKWKAPAGDGGLVVSKEVDITLLFEFVKAKPEEKK
jgi:polyisoprenoid-binding protein YceI